MNSQEFARKSNGNKRSRSLRARVSYLKKDFKTDNTRGLSLRNHFVLTVLRFFILFSPQSTFRVVSTYASVLFYSYSTVERASEQSGRPLALSSVSLCATNGLWIASSFCRATSFTEGFHSPLYPRAHRATVKINLAGSLNTVKFERRKMIFRNPQKPPRSRKFAQFNDY